MESMQRGNSTSNTRTDSAVTFSWLTKHDNPTLDNACAASCCCSPGSLSTVLGSHLL
jgi:hypothetical protein